MTDTPKYSPEIDLQTALAVNGADLVKMAGYISASRTAGRYDLWSIERSITNVVNAVADYRLATEPITEIAPLRPPSIHSDDCLPSDTEPEAAA